MPIANPKYRLTNAMLEGAPSEVGLYALWDGDELIYLGRASPSATIRACLVEHFVRRVCPCTAKATHYSWELSLRPAARELEILSEFMTRNGRKPRCNQEEEAA
jgi:hypothetical protein